MKTTKPRVGIIGCGHRMEQDLFPRLYGKVKLQAVCEVQQRCIDNFQEKFPGEYDFVEDYRKVVERDDVDWVLVCTPNYLHREHVVASFENGKHVFCEKPIATTIEDCVAINNSHLASGKLFATGFVLRYAPHYRKIKELLDGGAIGDIISLEFNECVPPNHGGHIAKDGWRRLEEFSGGHLLEKCCHDIDLAHWLTGSLPRRVASFGGLDFYLPKNAHLPDEYPCNKRGDKLWSGWNHLVTAEKVNPFTTEKTIVDNQVAILEFANGVRATFHTNLNAAKPERRFYIIGSRGTITADLYHNYIKVHGVSHNYFGGEGEDYGIGDAHMHGGADPKIMAELLESMQTGSKPKSSGAEGLRSAVTSLAIERARKEGVVLDLTDIWASVGIEINPQKK